MSGGTGKTYFTCGIAAFVSTGKSLPGDYKPPGGGENVLIISAEDRGEMLKKRLSASGADLNRVFIIDCLDSVGMNFSQGIETFKMTIQQYNPRLVIVDPWHAFLGEDVDINRVNAVRPVFQQIANVAKDCNCGMILISHVNKRAQGENANNAATGSSDFVNAARSAIYIIFDESCEDGRIAVHTKTNYAKYGRSVCFQITENGGLLWTGFSEIDRGTMEEAARHRKTPGEVIKDRDQISETRETLVRALIDAANPFEITRFTYDQFREAYGDSIFGTMQAKRILDSCAGILSSKGYILQTGIKVRDGNSKSGGFAIRRADLACTQNEDD